MGCLFLLNWIVSLTLSLTIKKLSSKKIGALIRLWSFLLLRLLHKYITRSCMEYCCEVLTGAPDCCWEILDKLQVCRTLAYRWNVASLRTYFFGWLKIEKFDHQFSQPYRKKTMQIADMLLSNKAKIIFRAVLFWSKIICWCKKILIALFQTKIETKKSSSETRLESYCN